MAISAVMVKQLRDSTGAGVMDAKKALTHTDGDIEGAVVCRALWCLGPRDGARLFRHHIPIRGRYVARCVRPFEHSHGGAADGLERATGENV